MVVKKGLRYYRTTSDTDSTFQKVQKIYVQEISDYIENHISMGGNYLW